MSKKLSWVSRVGPFPSNFSSYNLVCKPHICFNQLLLTRMTSMTKSRVGAGGKLSYITKVVFI